MLRAPGVASLLALALAAQGCASGGEPAATAPQTASSATTVERTAEPTTTVLIDISELRPPEPAEDPAALAAQIEAAETTIRDPTSPELAVAGAALAQQVAYRQLGRHPEWDAPVAQALSADLARIALRNATARREFRAMHTRLPTTLPAWRIVEPVAVDELLAIYREAEAAFGIGWHYLAAVNLVETGFGRIRGTSTAGAQGPMQFLPSTWEAYGAGGDIDDPRDAVMGAARYLAANRGATDIDNALFRYNNSQRYVRGVKLYAELMAEHPRAVLGYYHWGIWYLTERGEVYLPVGYSEDEPAPLPG